MTVSAVVDHNDYTGNGVTTSFPYTFRIFKKTDLAVSVVDLSENITELVLDTDYTVTNAGGYNGGNVVLTAPLAAGWKISISRELEPTQEIDLRNQGKFFAEVHEDALDKLTMLIQQGISMLRLSLRKPTSIANWYDAMNNYIRNLKDPRDPQDAATKSYVDSLASTNLGRTLRVSEQIPQLPDAATRANKIPAFDSIGNPIVVLPPSGSASDVLLELASTEDGKGDALIGVKNSRWNGVARTQHDVNFQVVSLKDFGAKLDGVTDDTAAIQAAIDAIPYNTFINDTQIPRANHEYSTYWLDGSPGIALVSDSIILKGGVNIRNITLRADFGSDGNAWNNKPVLKTDGNRYWGDAENIIIDGNHAKCKGIAISSAYGAIWRNIRVINTQLECFTNVSPGYEFTLDNFRFSLSGYGKSHGQTYQDTVSGLYTSSADGRYINGDILFCPIGVYVGGGNYYDNIHCWSGYYNNGFAGQIETRIPFHITASNNTLVNCYADSPSKKDYTQTNSFGMPDGLPNGGVGYFINTGSWNNTFDNCKWVVNDTLYSACTDARVGLTDQLRGFLFRGNNTNNRVTNFQQATAYSYVGDWIFADSTSQNTTSVFGVERRANHFFSRTAGQTVASLSTTDTGVVKLADFYGGSNVNTGYIQQRDTDSIRYYARRSLQLSVGSVTPLEVIAGTDGAQAPTLRPMQTSVANLGDSGFRYITVYLTTNPNVSSAWQLKSDVEDIPDSLIEFALETPIKRYVLNATGKVHYGIIITEDWVNRLKEENDFDVMGMLVGYGDADDPNSEHYGQYYGLSYADWQNIMLEGLRRKSVM